jgi:peptide/nickel transport system substrate-binding protein
MNIKDLAEADLSRRTFLLRGGAGAASLAGISALLTACGNSATGTAGSTGKPPARPTGSVSISLPAEIASFDVRNAAGEADFVLMQLVLEGLTGTNPAGDREVGLLATSYEHSADGREYVFHMRPGVRFHDGEPFDSAAAQKALDYYVSKPPGYISAVLPPSWELDASDPTKLRVKLKQAFPDLAANLALTYIMSPKVVALGDKAKSAHPIGTGPYKFVSYQQGKGAVLAANEHYWGESGPYFAEVRLPVISDASTEVSALESGQIQVAPHLSPALAQQLKGASGVRVESSPSWNYQSLCMRTTAPPFDDVRVRRAVAYAIDRPAIVKTVMHGEAQVLDSYLTPGVYGYKVPATTYSYDPAKARALLKQAGGPAPKITFAVDPAFTQGQQVGEAVAAQLRDIGFQVDLRVVDPTLFSTTSTRYDLHLEEAASTPKPLLLVFNLPLLDSGWSPPAYQKLLGEMTTTPDGPKRLAQLAQLQEMLADQVPCFPLYSNNVIWGMREDIQGFQPPKTLYRPVYTQMYRA